MDESARRMEQEERLRRHHTGTYRRVYNGISKWECCEQPRQDAMGCQTGPARHHGKYYNSFFRDVYGIYEHRFVDNKWDCCNNVRRECVGCMEGAHPNPNLNRPRRFTVIFLLLLLIALLYLNSEGYI